MHRYVRAALLALAATAACAAPAAAAVPSNADWTEHYIADTLPYPAGQPALHADLLVPKGTDLTKDRLPVIVSVGPYFAHAGSTPTSLTPANNGPQLRWNDLIQDGELFERGYALLQVDLRGFGGSQGCNDFGGKGEQLDVKRAVEWAAAQPWSTGKVAIYGKSYDAWTAVMALDEKPEGLGAAVIQAPIIDGYRTLYQDGVHYDNGWYGTPALYQAIDFTPPAVPDITNGRAQYVAGFATGTDPACYATNIAMQSSLQHRDDPAGFWKERDLPNARGSDVATFWSHGFLDVNTKPDNFLSVWETLTNPDNRVWLGHFEHKRPNERAVGRSDFYFDQLFAFLDEQLRGRQSPALPAVEVEDSLGRWRAEAKWPPADVQDRTVALRSGSYRDMHADTGVVWSITEPLTRDAHIAGVPTVQVDLSTTAANATVIARFYDIDEAGRALLISQGAGKYRGSGAGRKSVELFPTDYVVPAGHRLGVRLTGTDGNDTYLPTPSGATVTIAGGTLTAPFLRGKRAEFLEGDASSGARLRTTVSSATIAANPTTWDGPPTLKKGAKRSAGKRSVAKRVAAKRSAGKRSVAKRR